MQHQRQIDTMQRILGVLICVCLVVRPLLTPLHLALEDHSHATGGGQLASHVQVPHHHHGHPHVHPHVHVHVQHAGGADDDGAEDDGADSEPDGRHPPHPADDHLGQQHDQLQGPAAPTVELPALPPAVGPTGWGVVVVAPAPKPDRRVPLRPPPRAPAQPRAPPAIT